MFAGISEADDADPSDDLADGEQFPDIAGFRILARLGGGGSGVVYRAILAGSERQVALKVFRQPLGHRRGSPEAQRAWRELHLLGQLRLPCLPQLHDYGDQDGRLYVATDLVDGLPLAEYCAERNLDRRARARLLAEVADAVQSLHQHGVIHRDIKPSNILINAHGQPFIIDLGLAMLISDDVMQTLTANGTPIGSPAFMAPEQARGEREKISTGTDIYGLGATALYVLTGQSPHETSATIHEMIRRVAQDPPRDPRQVDPSLPRPLVAILLKALAPNPSDRYVSAADLAEDLRRWLHREPVEAGGLSLRRRLGRAVERHPIMATAVVCTLIAAASLLGVLLSAQWLNAIPARVVIADDGQSARLLARDGRVLARWDGTILLAELVECPEEFGGGRRVVIARWLQDEPEAQSVAVFDADSPDQPLWQSEMVLPENLVPPEMIATYGKSFHVTAAHIADVFASVPGHEIIAISNHTPESWSAMQIRDLGGTVLDEVWHNGHLADVYWMADAGLLICCGVNSEAGWPERGAAHVAAPGYPMIVFAYCPRLDRHTGVQINSHDRPDGGPAVWYQAVLPPESCEVFAVLGFNAPPRGHDGGECVRLRLRDRSDRLRERVAWILDAAGQSIDRYETDACRTPALAGLVQQLRLGPLPARIRERAEEAEERSEPSNPADNKP